jgi:hypothetical protein
MKTTIFTLATLFLLSACSNTATAPTDAPVSSAAPAVTTDQTADLKTHPAEIDKMLADNYELVDSARGLLDDDIHTDLIYVLHKKTNKEGFEDEDPRPLMVFTGQADKTWKLAARADSIVMCPGCGGVFGDPYNGLSLGKQKFMVRHYAGSNWRWAYDATFAYSAVDKTWLMESVFNENSNTIGEPQDGDTMRVTAKNFGKVKLSEAKDPANYTHKK